MNSRWKAELNKDTEANTSSRAELTPASRAIGTPARYSHRPPLAHVALDTLQLSEPRGILGLGLRSGDGVGRGELRAADCGLRIAIRIVPLGLQTGWMAQQQQRWTDHDETGRRDRTDKPNREESVSASTMATRRRLHHSPVSASVSCCPEAMSVSLCVPSPATAATATAVTAGVPEVASQPCLELSKMPASLGSSGRGPDVQDEAARGAGGKATDVNLKVQSTCINRPSRLASSVVL
ncbi:hypothetical protein CKAH01_13511 [Colletotrichum kahawae]|uniref:Uncharacterized protein n=1 Tax=Colletotrichum kahawae TaxID=34407 RepID=A0AAD9YRF7_COLKA|nr:hypothetical protein CKAH01_13511 [Colletotrichum kahawae]